MATSLDDKLQKVRQWYKNEIHLVYKFRILQNEEQKIANPREKKVMERKMKHLQKKINQYMNYGEFLGLSGEETRKFNLAIVGEIKKGKNLQAIIQTLTNGQK
ncbi:MAG TPA: hypothetical protein VMV66_00320 [Candidatus Humimicrobiaceae bacterium]|nr:hypothetical protein [Candidatus Humimicrobiaceae bacterium]